MHFITQTHFLNKVALVHQVSVSVYVWQYLFHCMGTDLSVQLEVQRVRRAFCLTACTGPQGEVAIETNILSQHRWDLRQKYLSTSLSFSTTRSIECAFSYQTVIELHGWLHMPASINQSPFITSSHQIDKLKLNSRWWLKMHNVILYLLFLEL